MSAMSASVRTGPTGTPAYAAVPAPTGRPGTMSKGTTVLATASASLIAPSSVSTSPLTRRTTCTPVRASASTALAMSAGSPSAVRTSPVGEVA